MKILNNVEILRARARVHILLEIAVNFAEYRSTF